MGMLIKGWVVLPDRPDAQRMVAKWPSQSRWALAHASGNLWLVGSLDHQVTLASAGPLRVAVIGSCPVTATGLTDLVTGMRTVAELDAVARTLPGYFHLVASVDGVVRVQGSVIGMRQVFHARIQRVPIAGDRADMLVRMAGAGVRALAPDCYLRIDSSGMVDELQWRQQPEPEVALTVAPTRR